MAEQSIWKKELSLGRRKPAPPLSAEVAEPPLAVEHSEAWEPVKRAELWAPPRHVEQESLPAIAAAPQVVEAVAPVAEPSPASPPALAALDPKFRDVATLAKLVERRASEYPGRVDEWRQLLPRLAERAENGVLPVELDGVVRTLFYELLHVGPNAPASVEQPSSEPKRPRLQRSTAPKPQKAAPPAEQTETPVQSGLRREIQLPKLRKRVKSHPSEAPTVLGEPVAAKQSGLRREIQLPKLRKRVKSQPAESAVVPAEPAAQQPGLRREIHLPKLRKRVKSQPSEIQVVQAEPGAATKSGLRRELHLPKLTRGPRKERAAKPEKQPKAAKQAKQSGLRRELKLPSLKLPSLSFSLQRGDGRSKQGTERLVGLRIGSSQLAAALVHNNGSAELLQLARSPLEHGVVVGGEVKDPEALARSLKAFFKEHKLPLTSVRVGIANNRIGVRMLEVPAVDDPEQFENAVRFRTQEVLPIPILEAVVDHVTLDEVPDADGKRRVLVVFAHKDLVDGYVDACKRAGLKLAGIDLDAFALLRALSEPPAVETETRTALVAVAIGHERTIFAVSDGRVCDFTRVLEWGGVWLDTALERALDLSPEQAAQIKHSLSLTSDVAPAGLSPVQVEAARSALRHEVDVLGRELLSSLQFYQSRPGSLDIGEILLSGGGAQLEGIDAELTRMLGVPVRLGDPLGRVTLGKNVVRPAESGSLAIAVGLAIEEQH